MAIKLMYITNNPSMAVVADKCGVDRIFIDLETVGKAQRQANRNTVISCHSLYDIDRIKPLLQKAKVIVRANPIHSGSAEELELIANSSADIVMLPYFKAAAEVKTFISAIKGRKKVCLLFETPEAVENAEEILSIEGIDEAFIGLNDLHIGYGMKFMFEPLTNGTVEKLCNLFAAKGIPYGFGGMARLNEGTLSAKLILGEHYRLSSSCVILSRSFCNNEIVTDIKEFENVFANGVKEIREYETVLEKADMAFFTENKALLDERVKQIVAAI